MFLRTFVEIVLMNLMNLIQEVNNPHYLRIIVVPPVTLNDMLLWYFVELLPCDCSCLQVNFRKSYSLST